MNRLYIILVFLVTAGCKTHLEHRVIMYDALEGKFECGVPIRVVKGTPVSIRITNINVDSVLIPEISQTELVELYTDIPDFFKGENLAETKNIDKADTTALSPPLLDSLALSKTVDTTEVFMAIKKEYLDFRRNYIEVQKILQAEALIKKMVGKPILDATEVKINVQRVMSSLDLDKKPGFETVQHKIDSLISSMYSNYVEVLHLEKILNRDKRIPDTAKYTLNILNDSKEVVGKTTVKIPLKTEKLFQKELAHIKLNAKKTLSDSAQLAIHQKGMELVLFSQEVYNSPFAITTDPVIIDGEGKKISYKIKNSKGDILREISAFEIKTKGIDPVINFSTGYFLSFVSNEKYAMYQNEEGTSVGVVKSNEDELIQALGGLMHVYPRLFNGFEMGGSAGISLTANGDIGFYGGVSMFFLAKNRLVLTGGYSFLKVDRLDTSNLLIEEGDYVFRNPANVAISYDSVYRGAPFIGITYNLSK